jgi:hypothetical protein
MGGPAGLLSAASNLPPALPRAMEGRATLCLVAQLSADRVRYEQFVETFSGCSTWPAASFCCAVYEMAPRVERDPHAPGQARGLPPDQRAASGMLPFDAY